MNLVLTGLTSLALIVPQALPTTYLQDVNVETIHGSKCAIQIQETNFTCSHLAVVRKEGKIFFFFHAKNEEFALVYAATGRAEILKGRAYYPVYKTFVYEKGKEPDSSKEVSGYCSLEPEVKDIKAGCVAEVSDFKAISAIVR